MKRGVLQLLLTCVLWWSGQGSFAQKVTPMVVKHTPKTPRSGEKVVITAESSLKLDSITLEYQVVEPGAYVSLKDPRYQKQWVSAVMQKSGDTSRFSAEIPESAQKNRTLVRYRLRAQENGGNNLQFPKPEEDQPNYAYFVYDGIPGWKAAIDPGSGDPRKSAVTQFSPEVMRQVQTYFLVANIKEVENATWYQQSSGKEYRYTGTFVADGKVYDHVPFRARGGAWRHSMGKNMWKFNFNKGHHLEAKDDYGNRYKSKWGKLNLRACIQQGDYGRRGEQGMYEAVGFRLFNLAGVDAPRTHWVTLRIVGEKEENPSNQYRGDFWGLYLAIENEDGDFLEEHGLPDGNVYKMMFHHGELSHQAPGAAVDGSDLRLFQLGLGRGNPSESWWRKNVDLPRYYSYRAIIEAIHHYDVGDGKNYDYYLNPKSGKWCVIPWDIDLTWGDHMFGSGWEPFYRGVTAQPTLKREYQNRMREIRDLLFNPQEMERLIDECAAIISRPGALSIVDADRMKWDYHPIMSSRYVTPGKAEKGLFYEAVRTKNFSGMVEQMKEYVRRRASYMDRSLLTESAVPATPDISYTGATAFPVNRLGFKTSSSVGKGGIVALEWRVAEIDRGLAKARPTRPGHYEITASWDSGEQANEQVNVPPVGLEAGSVYRVRCRAKDEKGTWGHWSAPIEFVAGAAAN